MKRSNVNAGTRAEVLAELEEYGSDRARQGNAIKAAEYARAIAEIEGGADVVRVRSSVWRVTDNASSLPDRELSDSAI